MKPKRRPSSFHRSMLGVAAWLVPGHEREDWRAEWISELWYVIDAHRSSTRFCMGAFHDASWLRIDDLRLKKGLVCFAGVHSGTADAPDGELCAAGISLAAGSWCSPAAAGPGARTGRAIRLPDPCLHDAPRWQLPGGRGRTCTGRAGRIQWWAFLAAKLALLVPAVFFGNARSDSDNRSGWSAAARSDDRLSYLAFRWALGDQCRRCPVCLRLLGNPVRIGQRSHIFWNGTALSSLHARAWSDAR